MPGGSGSKLSQVAIWVRSRPLWVTAHAIAAGRRSGAGSGCACSWSTSPSVRVARGEARFSSHDAELGGVPEVHSGRVGSR